MSAKRTVHLLASMADRILASSKERRSERLIARFSTRQIEDIGFERDWDGSVYRPEQH